MITISEDQNTVILDGEVHKAKESNNGCDSCSFYYHSLNEFGLGKCKIPCESYERGDWKQVIFEKEEK